MLPFSPNTLVVALAPYSPRCCPSTPNPLVVPFNPNPLVLPLLLLTGGELLSSVRSNSLSSALFDLYLGDEPVSAKTKVRQACTSLAVVTEGLKDFKTALLPSEH